MRKEVKLFKAFYNISYTKLANIINIKQSSFYSWLKGNYNLSDKKLNLLKNFIIKTKENNK